MKDTHSLPVRARNGVLIVSARSDWSFTIVIVALCSLLSYICDHEISKVYSIVLRDCNKIRGVCRGPLTDHQTLGRFPEMRSTYLLYNVGLLWDLKKSGKVSLAYNKNLQIFVPDAWKAFNFKQIIQIRAWVISNFTILITAFSDFAISIPAYAIPIPGFTIPFPEPSIPIRLSTRMIITRQYMYIIDKICKDTI